MFSFEPKLLFVSLKNYYNSESSGTLICLCSTDIANYITGGSGTFSTAYLTFNTFYKDSNKIYWYSAKFSDGQCNVQNREYNYIIIY